MAFAGNSEVNINLSTANNYFDFCQRPTERFSVLLARPLIIIGILANYAVDFGIVYLLRKSASFLSALEPVLGIVDRIRGQRVAHSLATGPPGGMCIPQSLKHQ